MTNDFTKLSQSLQRETRDNVLKREIEEKSSEIAKQLKDKGVYVNSVSGLRISIA